MSATFYVRTQSEPTLPPPPGALGLWAMWRARLFADASTTVLTLVGVALLALCLPPILRFTLIDAVWSAPDGKACAAPGAGACWAFIAQKSSYFMYGAYPVTQHWRVNATLLMGAILVGWLLTRRAPKRNIAAILFFLVYPIVSFFLLRGSDMLGLPVVPTDFWGGIFVTFLVATIGIVFSLPLGVLLALGRRSQLPIVRYASIIYIEFMRGVPMITMLFMANLMLPLFLPDNWSPDRLLRPIVGVALFAASYMAEEVRGGLQAMPKGQFEGAMALGLNYVQRMRFIILPQVLTLIIPGIVNTFIWLFKDTTLVSIVGIYDFLLTVETARKDPEWAGPTIAATGYIFAACFYFVFCFGMSRYSLGIERAMARGRAH